MNIEGTVTWIGELSEKSNGTYKLIDFVIKTEEEHPQIAMINIFGKGHEQHGFKAERFADEVVVGQKLNVEFNMRAREYNGKYYNDLSLWNYKKICSAPVQAQTPPVPSSQEPLPF